jgi:hypothetical protein
VADALLGMVLIQVVCQQTCARRKFHFALHMWGLNDRFSEMLALLRITLAEGLQLANAASQGSNNFNAASQGSNNFNAASQGPNNFNAASQGPNNCNAASQGDLRTSAQATCAAKVDCCVDSLWCTVVALNIEPRYLLHQQIFLC